MTPPTTSSTVDASREREPRRCPSSKDREADGEKFRMARLARVGGGVDLFRLTGSGEVPAGQIEEMDRLFQDPIPDPLDPLKS